MKLTVLLALGLFCMSTIASATDVCTIGSTGMSGTNHWIIKIVCTNSADDQTVDIANVTGMEGSMKNTAHAAKILIEKGYENTAMNYFVKD